MIYDCIRIVWDYFQNSPKTYVSKSKKMPSYKLKCPDRNVQYGAGQCRFEQKIFYKQMIVPVLRESVIV